MNKTILKNFAIYSRNKLIQEITNKAAMIGITEEGITRPLPDSTSDLLMFDIQRETPYLLKGEEIRQYHKLINELKQREENDDYETAYETLIEEIAYTWFNRLIAMRFMEVNHYMPNRLRTLSSGIDGVNEPELVTNYTESGLSFTEEESKQLIDWRMDASAQAMDQMFRFLFIKQVNALNENLPELFEKTDDYAELLLTISYNDSEGVLYKLVHEVPEEYFDVESGDGNGQVEIIGWLYQYYNSEKKDEVINIVNKKAIDIHNIPAATQLFTTDWVVKYMVDNSLGKYWLERNPDSPIKESLEFLMPGEITVIDEEISPEDLKVFDNAMGSGHILSYAFDVLLKIYQSKGYSSRNAAKLIIKNNLYGLEIDQRAYQLSYFAIMMKARQYNRRALNGEIKTNLAVFEDSTTINKEHLEVLGQRMDSKNRDKARKEINYLIEEFENATEIGSIMLLEKTDRELVSEYINDGPEEGQMTLTEIDIDSTQKQLKNIVNISSMLTNKYDVLVTNPPYMNKFSTTLKKYVNKRYKNYNKDLFSVFIYRNLQLTKENGYSAYMTPMVWMFIKSYEKLRNHIISENHIASLIQMEYSAFEEATVPICTFVLQNIDKDKKGNYVRLSDFKGGMQIQKEKTLEAINNPKLDYYYETSDNNYKKIPGSPIAYWASENLIEDFEKGILMEELIEPKVGLQTGSNKKFIRLWHEVNWNKVNINSDSIIDSVNSKSKWFPYNKGGARRQWYGNYDYVVNWENDGYEIRNFKDSSGKVRSRPQNTGYYFKDSITWSLITSGGFSIRYREAGSIHDVAGMSAFTDNHDQLLYLLGLMSTKIADYIFKMLNPTLNLQIGDFRNFPVLMTDDEEVLELVHQNIKIAKDEWDSYEESWDFITHPFLKESTNTIEKAFDLWEEISNNRIETTHKNEEKLNSVFIKLYQLEDELTPEVSKKNITLRDPDIKKDIKSFISYAVGCIFGRYSLDVEGLAYAGGEWDERKYESFKPVEDNVVLITDEEYFEDDLVNRFVEFVTVAYGKETLEENLDFIADSLPRKGSAREKIRSYFINNFYADHVKTYKKHPIYWLYDSSAGKTKRNSEDGFKALVYMHRYDEDTTGKVRTDYLHKVQRAYEFKLDNLNYRIENSEDAREIADAEKEVEKLTKQLKECRDYDEKIGHLALQRIPIDLDDGVKVNYDKVQTDENGKKIKILAKR